MSRSALSERRAHGTFSVEAHLWQNESLSRFEGSPRGLTRRERCATWPSRGRLKSERPFDEGSDWSEALCPVLTTRADDAARGLLEQLVFRRPPVVRDSRDLPSAMDE